MKVYRITADGGVGNVDLDKLVLAEDASEALEQFTLPKKYSDTRSLKLTYVGEM